MRISSLLDRWAMAWLNRGSNFYEQDEDPAQIRLAFDLAPKGLTGLPRTIDVSALNLATTVFWDNTFEES